MLVECVLLLFCNHLLLGGAVSEFIPTVYPAKIVSSSQCSHRNLLHDEKVRQALEQIEPNLSSHSSCKSILNDNPSAPSGYYNITTADCSAVQVYCDMEGTHCGGEGGWTRVTYVDMTQDSATCPQGLEQMSFNGSPYCGRFSSGLGCSSALLDTTISYQQVCGRVAGYQDNNPEAFCPNAGINEVFLDGVSIMYGSPRKHLWSYVVGFSDYSASSPSGRCPCNSGSTNVVPPFVGSDYYCESGTTAPVVRCERDRLEFTNDVLWDGQRCCCDGNDPCCRHPNMPWFIKTLNETTTEDIELRACSSKFSCGTGSCAALFLIEIYVR